MSDQDVLNLIPELEQARIAAGEDLIVRVSRLKLDPVATAGVLVSAVPSHRANTILRGVRSTWSINEE